MKHKLALPVVLTFCAGILVVVSLGMWQWTHYRAIKGPSSLVVPAAPLIVSDSAPIGLIGTITAVGSSTVTIEGQPPGNTKPIILTVLVDSKTSITKVGSAPAYATSTAKFSDFKMGLLLNIAADPEVNGVRHAVRIIVPPSQQ